MEFAKRLEQLMKEQGITQVKLSQSIGYSQRAVSKWINGEAEPTATAIVLCANYFEVTSDYLLGLEDETGAKVKCNFTHK